MKRRPSLPFEFVLARADNISTRSGYRGTVKNVEEVLTVVEVDPPRKNTPQRYRRGTESLWCSIDVIPRVSVSLC